MLKYPCLILDHDDTVVQTMKTLSYPFFCYELEQFRPGAFMSLEEYILSCHNLGFMELCRQIYHFTDEEMALEHIQWTDYIRTHIPQVYPGIERILRRQKEAGGSICVVSHSTEEIIRRDYRAHFGIEPDAVYGWDRPPQQRKPNPYPLLDIIKKWDLKPSQLLVVDDMKLACAMAKPLGVEVAFAGWNGLGIESLSEEMRQLCDHTFRSPQELEEFLFY